MTAGHLRRQISGGATTAAVLLMLVGPTTATGRPISDGLFRGMEFRERIERQRLEREIREEHLRNLRKRRNRTNSGARVLSGYERRLYRRYLDAGYGGYFPTEEAFGEWLDGGGAERR